MSCRSSYVFPVLLLVAVAVAQQANEAPPPSARNTAQDLTADQKSKVELLAKLQKHFEPNEELTIDSEGYGEKHHDKGMAQADGAYFMTLLPYIAGKKSGKTTIDVKSKNCNPKLTFEWGTYHLE